MTILCVATSGLPGIPPCGRHLESCLGDCAGCDPRTAERGFLCGFHFDRLEHAYSRWDEWVRAVHQLEGARAVQRDTAGVRTRAEGHVNLTGVYLALDECERLLASSAGHPSLEMWAGTPEGAADAVGFAFAAERAYRSHEVRERSHRIKRVRCPECSQLTMIWRPPPVFGGHVTVVCSNDECSHVMDQDSYEAIAAIEETRRTA